MDALRQSAEAGGKRTKAAAHHRPQSKKASRSHARHKRRAKQVRSTCLSGSEHGSSQSGQEQSSWPTRQQIWARCTASEGDEVNGAAATGAEGKCERIRPPESWRPNLAALLRADMCKGVAPLPLLADCSGGTGPGTAKASRSRLLALGAGRHHGLVPMGRVSQSNRHDNCKQRYSESLQHSFFLPR
jgi:hypothetical protein